MLSEIQSAWLKHLTSMEASDRQRAEAAVRAFYPDVVYCPPPNYFFWFDSPERAGWASRLLSAASDDSDQRILEDKSRSPERRLFLEGLRVELCEKARLEWDQLTKIAGMSRTQQTLWAPQRIELHGLTDLYLSKDARKGGSRRSEWESRVRPVLDGPDKDDAVRRIEDRFHAAMLHPSGLRISLSTTNSPYTYAKMAQDEEAALASGREVPPAIAAAWDLARSAGECWLFQGAVVFLDRPADLRFNSEMFLHCDDGPAVAFRDGAKIWAWNGIVTDERVILHPEDIPADEWQQSREDLPAEYVARIEARRYKCARS